MLGLPWLDLEALEEATRTLGFLAAAAFLFHRGRSHHLRAHRGWGLLVAGLALLGAGSAIDLLDEFNDPLPAWMGAEPYGPLEVINESVAPVAGTVLVVAGLVAWLKLPARLSRAEHGLAQANKELQSRTANLEKALHTLLANAPDYVLLIDENDHVAFTNRTPAGLDPKDVIGQPIAGFVPDPVERQAMLTAIHGALRDGQSATVDVRGPGPNGRLSDYTLRIAPSNLPDGRKAALMLNVDVTDQHRRIEELRARTAQLERAEVQFRSLAENFPDYVTRFDRDLKRVYVNPALRQLWARLGAPEPQGTKATELVVTAKDQQAELEGALRAVFATGEIQAIRQRVALPDGVHLVEGTLVPERSAGGQVESVLAVARDVTATERAKAELEASEERFRMAARATQDVIWDIDLATGRTLISDAVRDKFGHDPARLPSMEDWGALVHPDDRPALDARIQDALANGLEVLEAEFRFRHGDGHYGLVRDSILVHRGRDGKPTRLVGAMHDVSTERAREAELRDAELRYRLATNATHDVIWDWDLLTGALAWGGSLRDYGHDPATLTHITSWDTNLHPDDRDRVMRSVDAAIAAGQTLWSSEYRFRHADGHYVEVLDRGTIVRDARGQAIRMVGAMTDLTDRRRAEAQARQAELLREQGEFKTRFLNAAAHELATPLTPLKLQMASLLKGHAGPIDERQRQSLDLLQRNLGRLGTLVQDLLDAARLQSGALKVRPHPIDLNEIMADVLEMFKPKAAQDGIHLRGHGHTPVVAVVDPDRVSQVLTNLVHNALKFTPKGGAVDVAVTTQGSDALITVQDTGAGLQPGQLERLFQPFVQMHEDLGKGGTGLGLYVSRGIAQQHGGDLAAASRGPGLGSTFTVRLPMAGPPTSAGLALPIEPPAHADPA